MVMEAYDGCGVVLEYEIILAANILALQEGLPLFMIVPDSQSSLAVLEQSVVDDENVGRSSQWVAQIDGTAFRFQDAVTGDKNLVDRAISRYTLFASGDRVVADHDVAARPRSIIVVANTCLYVDRESPLPEDTVLDHDGSALGPGRVRV